MINERFMDKEELTQKELDAIDKNWKQIIKLANKAFETQPHATAIRAIERALEKIGVDNFHSGTVAAAISDTLSKAKAPKTKILQKVQPHISGDKNKGSGFHPGGSTGMGAT